MSEKNCRAHFYRKPNYSVLCTLIGSMYTIRLFGFVQVQSTDSPAGMWICCAELGSEVSTTEPMV